MKAENILEPLTPKERDEWERCRKRGKSRYVLAMVIGIGIPLSAVIFFFARLNGQWAGGTMYIRIGIALVIGIPMGGLLGVVGVHMLWTDMERRYRETLECEAIADEPENAEHKIVDN